jgi:c-di-GMP-related signal transduction protein
VDFRKEGIYLEVGKGERKKIGVEYRPVLGIESFFLEKGKDERTDLVFFKFLAGSAIVEEDHEKGLVFIDIKPTTVIKYPNDVVQFLRKNMVLDIQGDYVSREILEKLRDFAKNRDVLLSVDDYGRDGSNKARVEILRPAYVKIDLQASEEKFDFVLWSLNEIKRVSETTEIILKNVSTEEELEKMKSFGIKLWQGKLERTLSLLG